MPQLRRSSSTEAGRVYDYVKWAVLNAVYEPGDLLTLSFLISEVGAAAPAVREAVVRLDVEGLIRFNSEGAAVVSRYSSRDAEDVLEARQMLELFVADRCFERRHQVLAQCEHVHAEMKANAREQDTAAFTRSDRRFHEALVDASGNRLLSEFYRSLRERQSLFTASLVRGHAEMMQVAVDEHERIMGALRGDDPVEFRRVVESHLQFSIDLARSHRGSDPGGSHGVSSGAGLVQE